MHHRKALMKVVALTYQAEWFSFKQENAVLSYAL